MMGILVRRGGNSSPLLTHFFTLIAIDISHKKTYNNII